MQPVHLREDAATARRDWGARAEVGGYTWRSLLDAGATLAFGTDAPVEPIDPWPGIALAVLRHDPSWGADVDAVRTRTRRSRSSRRSAPRRSGRARRRRIRSAAASCPGARADLIVLPAAPREASDAAERAAAFAEVRPRLVMLDGEVVFER